MGIKELNDKYLVFKLDDIKNSLSTREINNLKDIIESVNIYRTKHGKFPQRYAVLNTSDEANLDYLIQQLVSRSKNLTTPYIPVNDLSLDVINSILIAGNPN